MKKLLSIVLALSLVLGMLPVFAVDAAQTSGDKLKELGMLKSGDRPGDYLTRAEAAVIITQALGKFDELDAKKGTAVPATGMSDEKDFPAWAAHHIAFVISEGIFKGFPDKSFKHKNHLSAEQFATILRRILKHDNEAFGQNIQELNKLGINIQSAEQIKRGDAFDAFFTAAVLPIHNSGNSLIHVLGKEELAIQKGFINENKAHELIINNVEADNLKQIKVSFNQKVKDVTKETFKLSDSLKIESAELAEDDQVVILTLEKEMKNQKKYKLSAKSVMAADEKVAALEVKDHEFDCFDGSLPEVKSIEFSGPKNLLITFNEPMNGAKKGTITIKTDKSTLAVNSSKSKITGNLLTVETYSDFKASATYDVTVADFADYAGYGNINKTESLVYEKNTEAPTVTEVTADSVSVTIKFSKLVKGLEAKLFYHSFTSYNKGTIAKLDGSSLGKNDLVNGVKITFYNNSTTPATGNALPSKGTLVGILGDTIVDAWGNKLGNFEKNVDVVADKEAPEVEKVEVDGKDVIKVTFTKEVNLEAKHVELKNEKGNSVAFRKPVVVKTGDRKVWKIQTSSSQEGNTLTLVIKGAQGVTPDMLTVVSNSNSVNFGDQTPPEVAKVALKTIPKSSSDPTIVGGELYFFFNEPVAEGALDGANYSYKIGSVYTQIGGNGEFLNDESNVVMFSLSADLAKKINNGGTAIPFLVTGVKDLAKVQIIGKDTKVWSAFNTAVKPELAKNADGKSLAVVESAEEIVLTFDSDITVLDVTKITVGAAKGKGYDQLEPNKIRVYLDAEITNWNKTIAQTLTLGADAVQNSFEVKNGAGDISAVAVIDAIKPKFVAKAAKYDKTKAEIQIPLTKELKGFALLAEYVASNDIEVTVNGRAVRADQIKVSTVGSAFKVEDLSETSWGSTHDYALKVEVDPKVLPAGQYQLGVKTKTVSYLKSNNGEVTVGDLDKTFDVTYTLLLVESVRADQAAVGATVTVTFNHDVDAVEAEKLASYTFGGGTDPTAAEFDASSGKAKVDGEKVQFKTATNAIVADTTTITIVGTIVAKDDTANSGLYKGTFHTGTDNDYLKLIAPSDVSSAFEFAQ